MSGTPKLEFAEQMTGDGEENEPPPPVKKRKTDDGSQSVSRKASASTESSGENPHDIDESLYSRQLYVLGQDAMLRMAQSDVLVCGMGGLGVEIAKNIILGGVHSVTIHDEALCTTLDLSTQYYLSKESLGENRATASKASLARLNQYVRVEAHTEPLSEEFLKQFSVVVLVDTPLDKQEDIGAFLHENNISLIVADTRGLAGQIFCDFGEKFRILDPNGEEPLSVSIACITKDTEGVVTCLDHTRHGFEDGDYVTFSEVKGMTEINNCSPMKVKVLGPDTFSIGDTTQFGDYTVGGVATQVNMPKDITFKSFRESMAEPEFVTSDFAKMGRPPQLHLGFQALQEFQRLHSCLPRPWNKEDAEEVVRLAKEKNTMLVTPLDNVDEAVIMTLSYVSAGSLCPMQAVTGSIAAQEVMKACSGKFQPIQQWFYFDAFECLPQDADVSEASASAMEHSRYAGQARVFGTDMQEQLMSRKYFVVGTGAVGCELLKNFAMMGLGGNDGLVHVTDMDVIERSNLNRQFLFRPEDVGQSKSTTAARAVREINPGVNIAAHEDRVGPKTESVYNDDFFKSLDCVVTALDNLDTCLYMDKRCMYYQKPLLDCGAMGTKGNVQVVKPGLTESYSLSQHPRGESIPAETIKHFPNNIKHTLQWARDQFDGLFKEPARNALQYLTDPKFRPNVLEKPELIEKVVKLEEMKKMILDYRATDFDDCVAFAHMCFEEQYKGKIEQLLRIFPKNYETKSGMPFWSGLKRCPHPIEFDPENALHIDYIVSAANLRATMFGIPHITDRKVIAEMLSRVLNKVEVPAFHPPPNPDPSVSFHHGSFAVIQNDSARLDQVIQALADWDKLKDMHLTAIEFNKDNDLHVDFIVAASNLRATNYNIVPSDKGRSKLIVDEIIPASSTTTSLVAGLACLELLKLAQNHEKLELFRNSFVNLALPFFSFSEPIPPAEKTVTTAMEPCDVKVCSAEATARSSESYILELQLEFDDILQKGTRTSALEEMQRSVYNLVARKQEDQIYDSVCHALITRLRKVRATVLDKVDERFVETVTQAWREYIERARMVCDVVEYLEKVVVPQSHLDCLRRKSVKLFRDEVLRCRDVQAKLCNTMLRLVKEDRKGGRPVNRAILKEACDMLAAVDTDSNALYEQVFEREFLKESAEFYTTLDLDLKENSNYISQVEGLLEKESELSKSCFRGSTVDELISVLIEELVLKKDSLMRCILSDQNTAELARIVTMCRPINNGIAMVVSAVSKHTLEMGEAFVSGHSNTPNVAALIGMKKYLDHIAEQCFDSDERVKEVFSEDFARIILMNSEMPSHLAAFVVDTIEKSITNFERQLLTDVEECCRILKLDKEIFEMYCQFFWAKKLLMHNDKSSEETEKPSAVELQRYFTQEFVSWMQAFDKELQTSQGIALEFKKLHPSATINVSTLQAGLLPVPYETQKTIIAQDPWKEFRVFKNFYFERHVKRQLILQPNLGSASMSALFQGPQSPRKYALCVTTHQMCILLLFNDCNKMSFRDIADRTNIPNAALICALKSLIEERSSSTSLLFKSPSSESVNFDDFFIVNEEFMSNGLADFTKVPAETKFLMKSTEPHYYIDKQRMFQVEATIVRIMKAQRKMAQNELLCEVNKELGGKYTISPAAFQKRLDSLVQRQFIEKAFEDPTKYSYVP